MTHRSDRTVYEGKPRTKRYMVWYGGTGDHQGRETNWLWLALLRAKAYQRAGFHVYVEKNEVKP